jgi:hypothetical protein
MPRLDEMQPPSVCWLYLCSPYTEMIPSDSSRLIFKMSVGVGGVSVVYLSSAVAETMLSHALVTEKEGTPLSSIEIEEI